MDKAYYDNNNSGSYVCSSTSSSWIIFYNLESHVNEDMFVHWCIEWCPCYEGITCRIMWFVMKLHVNTSVCPKIIRRHFIDFLVLRIILLMIFVEIITFLAKQLCKAAITSISFVLYSLRVNFYINIENFDYSVSCFMCD